MSHLICQFFSVQYIMGIVLTLYLCIKIVAEDNCKFVAQHVTLQLKINIVLPDCMKWEDLSAILGELCRNPVGIIYSTFIWQIYCHLKRSVCKLLCNLGIYKLHIYKNTMFSCFHNKGNWIQFERNSHANVCCLDKNIRTELHCTAKQRSGHQTMAIYSCI